MIPRQHWVRHGFSGSRTLPSGFHFFEKPNIFGVESRRGGGDETGEERKRVVYVRFSSDVAVGDWKVVNVKFLLINCNDLLRMKSLILFLYLRKTRVGTKREMSLNDAGLRMFCV